MIKECPHNLLNCTLIIACLMSAEREIIVFAKLKTDEKKRRQEVPISTIV